jgi:hypothetical protein
LTDSQSLGLVILFDLVLNIDGEVDFSGGFKLNFPKNAKLTLNTLTGAIMATDLYVLLSFFVTGSLSMQISKFDIEPSMLSLVSQLNQPLTCAKVLARLSKASPLS